jgi:hypothetical protein
MNYSLGNMLSRGGALNPDGLALDLQFAADKTLTARRGPTPTFTRASTATFIGSDGLIQSAAINEARFDHDPITLACKGLLIEESRTNLLTQSESWQTGASFTGPIPPSVTNNTTISPDGSLSADTLSGSIGVLTDGSVNSTWRLPNISTATTYTFSIYVKSLGAATRAEIRIRDNSTGASTQTLDTALTANWKRVSVTHTTGATTTSIRCIIQNTDGPIAIWGAQLEAGSFSTSYIPTTTASVVRSADLCSISGSNFTGFWNQSAGTLVESFEASPNTNTTYASASNGNIVQNSLHLDNDTGLMRAVYYSGSSLVATLNLGAIGTVGAVNTISTAYSVNDFAASRNGAAVVVDTAGAVPASLTQINIGADERSQTPTSFYSNRCIKFLRYFKKRLPDAKLQTLST